VQRSEAGDAWRLKPREIGYSDGLAVSYVRLVSSLPIVICPSKAGTVVLLGTEPACEAST
jgi:hypothetical protein